jgi:hypothetical protein
LYTFTISELNSRVVMFFLFAAKKPDKIGHKRRRAGSVERGAWSRMQDAGGKALEITTSPKQLT